MIRRYKTAVGQNHKPCCCLRYITECDPNRQAVIPYHVLKCVDSVYQYCKKCYAEYLSEPTDDCSVICLIRIEAGNHEEDRNCKI